MKKIIITVPKEEAEKIEHVFSDTLYFIEPMDPLAKITIFAPDLMLEEMISRAHETMDEGAKKTRPLWIGIIDDIKRSMGEDDKKRVIEVISPDFVISPFLEKQREKFTEKELPQQKPLIEKIVSTAEAHTKFDLDRVVLAAIAGLVALIGLFINNVGIIIGAMLLSPLLGPIYALVIYTAIGDIKTVWKCLQIVGLLLLMIIGISLIATFVLSLFLPLPITPEIESRLGANAVYILMAVMLGFATIIALLKGIPDGIAGVAIAAALLPPAVVTGIVIVLLPVRAISALTLTLQNVVGLVGGMILATITLKIGPRDLFEYYKAKQLVRRVVWILGVLILLLFLTSLLL
ncbi:MAG: TIGR00341 family protein [Methanomicrobiales archaeon]|nr:TIGR00341 family protein [Methanomicrobiales archaeon]